MLSNIFHFFACPNKWSRKGYTGEIIRHTRGFFTLLLRMLLYRRFYTLYRSRREGIGVGAAKKMNEPPYPIKFLLHTLANTNIRLIQPDREEYHASKPSERLASEVDGRSCFSRLYRCGPPQDRQHGHCRSPCTIRQYHDVYL